MSFQTKNVACKENVIFINLSDSEDNADKESCEDSVNTSSLKPGNTSKSIRNVLNGQKKCRLRKKCKKNKMKNMNIRSKDVLASSAGTEDSGLCKNSGVTSITEVVPRKFHCHRNKAFKSSHNKLSKNCKIKDVILCEPAFCPLRPIVIDGSNIAIDHGRVSHLFSSKGIQLAIDYFLNRGHTEVTAFVPQFRRNVDCKHDFPTENPEILEDLAKKQLVVFTPSREINGKCIASYDDRFIIELASRNGGIIVSNDNYRDLINESKSFKEAIEKRLLMFCFVGDVFMVPDDPLGWKGPRLKEYLCFPPDNKKSGE